MRKIIFKDKGLYDILGVISRVIRLRISIFEPMVRVSVFNTSNNYVNCVAYPTASLDSGFCYKLRFCEKIDDRCLRCDREAQEHVKREKQTYIYHCHLGLTEALIPVMYDGDVAAMFFIGQIVGEGPERPDFGEIYDRLSEADGQYFTPERKSEFESAYGTLTAMSSDETAAVCRMIEMLIPYLWEKKLISFNNNTLPAKIADFAGYNINKRITSGDMCAFLNISRSHLYRTIRREYGVSFSEYINMVKLEKACALLRTTDLTVKEIALSLGYADINYFSRIFKKYIGVSALKYRRNETMVLPDEKLVH